MYNPSWSFSTVFRTLPPLPSLTFGDPASDPADAMLAAVRAAGGCLEFPGRYEGRWVVLRAGGGVLRFPSPVGHRLASQGLICRHPGDVPGHAKPFARFLPKERMPKGFEFNLVVALKQEKAEERERLVRDRIAEREMWFAAMKALRQARKVRSQTAERRPA
jgi:hypothetical protein